MDHQEVKVSTQPHQNGTIKVFDNSVHLFVGKNGAGKSRVLTDLKNQLQNAVLLNQNFENVGQIQTVNPESASNEQIRQNNPSHVPSLASSDEEILNILKFIFKSLFDSELQVSQNEFNVDEYRLRQNADGFKSVFNLFYYLISPHKILLLDEPERFLHPSLRSIFISLVSEIAMNYEKKIFISTHSSDLMRFDLKNVHLYNFKKKPYKIVNLNNWKRSLTDKQYSAQKHKTAFLNWFYHHSDIVFSDYSILVEGVSDQIILESLRKKFSFLLNLENVSINYVASSYNEQGGKSRLPKIQAFLSQLLETHSLADLDILQQGIKKWVSNSDQYDQDDLIEEASKKNLHILKKGDIEDYYFIDSFSNYCKSVSRAKNNKIAAAYEQASIVSNKQLEEVKIQFSDIFEIFKIIKSNNKLDLEEIENLAKDYVIDKYRNKDVSSDHFKDHVDNGKHKVNVKFTDSLEEFSFSKEKLEKLREVYLQI